MTIETVTVIGTTGTMGANIAGLFAAFGNTKVYCVGRDIEKVRITIPRIIKSVRADAIHKNLIPADFSMLGQCISESDLIFESSAEDIQVKMHIAGLVGKVMRADAVCCTGTSGLSISRIASCYPDHLRGRFFGVHMFNPPYSMPLTEFIRTEYSDEKLAGQLKAYLEHRLYRTVVEVKDSPAFLANRIGFQFINEALQYAERYKDNGGIDFIDAILGPFTGRAMAPLVTSDFVGLDVHRAIVNNIYENTCDYAHETFVFPACAQKLVEEGLLGRKTGSGLYKTVMHSNGQRRRMVYDINTGYYRDIIPYIFPYAEKMKNNISEGDYEKAFAVLLHNRSLEADLCLSFLLKYMMYSFYAARNIGQGIRDADDVMAGGFNWCPPLAMYDAMSKVADMKTLLKERLPDIWEKIDLEELLFEVQPSKYDYRSYYKAGR